MVERSNVSNADVVNPAVMDSFKHWLKTCSQVKKQTRDRYVTMVLRAIREVMIKTGKGVVVVLIVVVDNDRIKPYSL